MHIIALERGRTRLTVMPELSVRIETDGWLGHGAVLQRVELLDDGLRETIEITAAPGTRLPAACGGHTWFRRDVRPGHDVRHDRRGRAASAVA